MLTGKNIVITGCLQGIGKETMTVFAQNHANIFACAYKQDEQFENYCLKLEQENGVKIYPIYFDMMNNDSIKEAARQIQKEKMEIHGLVNIAGMNRDANFGMITNQDLQDTFQVNVISQILLSQYVARIMQRYKTQGSIAFTSSITALDGNAGQVTYGASKAALIGAMRSMALELGASGIRVNAVAPGVIKTPMTENLPQEVLDKKIKTMEIPRLGEAIEVANVFKYLMSDLSTHLSGQVIRVDGGIRS